ncbi:serine protease [Photobacterium sp. TLY01]|uniref:S1 family serine peptidase n=1 Tax=Photobacterium sp. TLY01 TaxID=2907534 RepID=UPI001F25F3FE|nr:serine protease [Photobacterium sp. TLY01]UIP27312.1 serine protease [Photobacterium sp. TLY01]
MKAPITNRLLSLAFLLFMSGLARAQTDELPAQATQHEPTARIIGGISAVPGDIPWQAFINIDFSDNGTEVYLCGGVVIAPRIILTAAHCIVNGGRIATPLHVKVWAGITSVFSATSRNAIPVSAIIVHPGYNSSNFNNDIAVIRLSQDLPETAIPIQIASVSTQNRADAEFANTWVANSSRPANLLISGWGSVTPNPDSAGSTQLQQTVLSGVPDRVCDNLWGSSVHPGVYSIFVCASPPSPNLSRDSCFGDSGGPLVWQDPQASSDPDFGLRLLGLVSFGEGCAGNLPGVYTQVSTYLDWIAAVTGSDFTPASAPVFAVNPFLKDYSNAGLEQFRVESSGGDDSGGSYSLMGLLGLFGLLLWRFRTQG